MTTWNIASISDLNIALANASNNDTFFFQPGDYRGVAIDIAANKDLTFTSANAGIDPANWAPLSEVLVDRIVSNGSITVDGLHVSVTLGGALNNSPNGPYWQAIGNGTAGETVTVKNSILSIARSGPLDPGDQGFGLNLVRDTGDILVDHVHIGPFTGFPAGNSEYGMWINGSSDPGNSITVTNSVFDTQTPRAVAIALDTQVGGPQINISDNTFEDPGTAPGAIRFFQFYADPMPGTQDYSGITDNTLVGSGAMTSNETNTMTMAVGPNAVAGTDGDDVFVASLGKESFDGGNGNDTIDMLQAGSDGSLVDLDSGVAFSSNTNLDSLTSIESARGSAGDDGLYGNDGDNTFYVTEGADVVDGRGNWDTLDASDGTAEQVVDFGAGTLTSTQYDTSFSNIEAVATGSGDDTIHVVHGDNHVDGGDGFDTLVLDHDETGVGINWDANTNTFGVGYGWDTDSDDSDDGFTSVANVETVSLSSGHKIWLVTNSAELTAALNASTGAQDGDVIKLADGTYSGSFTIANSNITLESANGDRDLVKIVGGFRAANPGMGTQNLDTWIGPQTGYAGATPDSGGLVVTGDNITIRGLTITDHYNAILLGSSSDSVVNDVTIENVLLDNNLFGIHKEVGAVAVDGFNFNNSVVSHSYEGMDIVAGSGGKFENVHIGNVTFEHLTAKGIYTEQLSHADFNNITMTDVGQYGRGDAFGNIGEVGAGIDINLKYGVYTDINIHDFAFTDVGLSNGAGTSHFNSGAILIKARSDAPSYSGNPATVDGVNISNGTIDGTSTGIRIGEPGKPGTASDVWVGNVDITNAAIADYDNRTSSTLNVELGTTDPNPLVDHHDDSEVISNPDATGPINYFNATDTGTTYTVNRNDSVGEDSASGVDTVNARGSFQLGDNIENLVLLDAGSDTQDFENFNTGAIVDGENGWKHAGTHDHEVVDLGGNKVFRMSSDPHMGDFGGPYSPSLSVTAGEASTTADGDTHVIRFRVKPVSDTADNSRLEIDFGNSAGTDRNSFLVFESIDGEGLRIATAWSRTDGDFDTGVSSINDFAAFTGNQTLIDGLDTTVWHDIELRLVYGDGADDDLIEVYVDGEKVGETNSFENYRDDITGPAGHEANVEANQTNRIFFRGSASGAPQDGPGGQNQGFYVDDITNTITSSSQGIGNDLANHITGNSGNNFLDGRDGNDTLLGGDGKDTLDGGADLDQLFGEGGNDEFWLHVGDADTVDGGADHDVVLIDGTSGSDTLSVVFNGSVLTTVNGASISNVEEVIADLGGHAPTGDTLSYAGTTAAVAVNLSTGTASGFESVSNIENVVGGSGGDHLTGDGNANVLAGGEGSDTVDGGGGIDTVVFTSNINDYAVQYDSGTQTWAVTKVGTSEIDTVTGVEKFSFNGSVFDVTGNPNLIANRFAPVVTSPTTAAFDENAANPTVYTAAATDADSAAVFGSIVYSLEGPDAGLFTINSSTGVVKFTGAADFEADPSYTLTVRATQGITSSTRSVTLSVNDLNDNAPTFQSGSTASVDENVIDASVYDANATDADASFGNIVYSLEGANAAFTIDAASGVVRLNGAADFETQSSYAFTVRATQGATSTTKSVTLSVNNLNDNAPVFQSGTAASVAENTPASAVVYDANATDADSSATFGAIAYTLSGTDASAFTIDAATGEVRLKAPANFEAKTSYAFAVTATQGSTATTQNVVLAVTNVNEGVGGLENPTLTVEAGSTKTPIGTVGSTDGTTYDVVSVSAGGGKVYNGSTELAAGVTGLTLAQVNALTFSSGTASGSVQLLAHSGVDSAPVTITLNVTPGVSATYTGTGSADRLDGANGNDAVLGKNGADILIGGAGKDTISGGKGGDTIYGGLAKDVLTGDKGADHFVFDTVLKTSKADTITDFEHGVDKIVLDDAIFAAIGVSLKAKEFYASASGVAHDASDRLIYETDTGELRYDADGNGSGKAILVATLSGSPTVTLDDFLVV